MSTQEWNFFHHNKREQNNECACLYNFLYPIEVEGSGQTSVGDLLEATFDAPTNVAVISYEYR